MKTFKSLSVLLAALACCIVFTGCLSHWAIDSSTRLQVENKSSKTIVGIDIVSEDGSEYVPWIQDTIRPGEKSRVYEEDWVGTFNVRFRIVEKTMIGCACDNVPDGMYASCVCPVLRSEALIARDVEFEGGSEYVVITDSKEGHGLRYEFK